MSDLDPAALAPVLEAEALRERGPAACLGPGPLVLEIGFGRAELLLDLALAHPDTHFLGVEVSRKRVAKAAKKVARLGLENVRLVHAPAEYLLERALPPSCVAECWINFSDPWPKKRHFKRRLFQAPLLALLARALEHGARLHAATDHAGYAAWIHDVLSAAPDFENLNAPDAWTARRPERRLTSYEAEWLAEGRRIAYFEYCRK